MHRPVLLKESIDLLEVTEGTYVDCTLGGGGHTLEIVKRLDSKGSGKVISFDVDKEAIERFEKLLLEKGWKRDNGSFKKGKVRILLINKNFEKLAEVLQELGIEKVDGIMADLGMSSDQIEDPNRGFSYSKDGPLDMRMDKRLEITAKDLVNGLYEKELEKLFRLHDERYARLIARNIVEERKKGKIETTLHLVQIIKKSIPSKGIAKFAKRAKSRQLYSRASSYWKKPAMRVFQALRNQVNSELSSLQKMLPQALEALAAGKNLVIISFHSGEDRIVKRFFKNEKKEGSLEIITKKPIVPSEGQVELNERARSAKLRALRKL